MRGKDLNYMGWKEKNLQRHHNVHKLASLVIPEILEFFFQTCYSYQ